MRNYLIALILFLLPSPIAFPVVWLIGGRRNYKFGKKASVGFSIIISSSISLGEKSRIGHLNFIRVGSIALGENARIKFFNMIKGRFNVRIGPKGCINMQNRIVSSLNNEYCTALDVGYNSIIGVHHTIDMTGNVILKDNSILAGAYSQLWTHSFIHDKTGEGRVMKIGDIEIGRNCYIGSQVLICSGIHISDTSTIGAGAVVSKNIERAGLYVNQPLRCVNGGGGKSLIDSVIFVGDFMRRHYKELLSEVLKNGIFFVLSKGVAFCAPILFIRFVSLTEYGVVEYSYSTGSLLAMCTLLGLNGAYPYFILKKGETEKEEAFLFYGIPVAFISGLFYLGRYLGVVSQALSFIILFTLIFSLQRLYSTILKSGGKGYLGVLLDGGYYFVLALALVLFKVGGVGDAIDTLEKLMALYLGVLSLFYIWRYFVNKTKPFKHTLFKFYPEILGYSVKMIVSGLIIFFLVSSNRIYLKFLLGYEEVGIYSFYFRLVGIAVVIHQFLYIAFFKKIYLADSKKVDYYYLFMMIMVLSGCLLILFVFPFIKDIIGIQYEFNDVKLYLLLTVQMVLWVGISLCETIIGRENLIVRQNCYIGGCVAVFPIILWIISPYINLMNFTLANIVLLYVAMALQIKISNGINIKLNRCLCFNSVLLLSALIIYLI